MDVRLY